MPPLLGTYYPSAGFTAPRSYINEVDVALYGTSLQHTSSVWFIHAVPPDPTTIVVEWNPYWYAWNSKSYQLSELLLNFYYIVPPSPTETALPFTLGYWSNPTTLRTGLYLNWFTGSRLPVIAPVPPVNQPYWLPRPL